MSQEQLSNLYDANFYMRNIEGMTNSAHEVLALLYKCYRPQSVIDIGCGRGAWLAVAESLGSTKLKGLDGSWVKKEELLSKNINFTTVNFNESIPEIEEKYDLCISLEVAEHIIEEKAKQFVDILCKVSDVVLFSAAIKYQGGTNHINEQWQSYWVNLFKYNGYKCVDLFRPLLWMNESVEWWYRQNVFLFFNNKAPSITFDELKTKQEPMIDIVHPVFYEKKIEKLRHRIKYPTLRFCLDCIKRFVINKIRLNT